MPPLNVNYLYIKVVKLEKVYFIAKEYFKLQEVSFTNIYK